MNFYKHIGLIFLSFLLADEITLIGDSEAFIADTKYPEVSWEDPNEGDSFEGNEEVILQWQASDNSLGDEPISIYFSMTLSNDFELIFSNIENTQNINYTLPDINTQFARFKIVAVDMFGYQSEEESGYFTINTSGGGDDGGTDELEELIIFGDSESFVADTQFPQIQLFYPNGGETFDQGESIQVTWNATDESLGDNPISIFLTVNQDGNYESQAEFIANSGMFTATLPMQDTEYGRFKVTVIDFYGYESIDEGDGYFSIGAINEYVITDTSLVLESDSESFRTDTVDPVITVIYPNGGEHVIDYENVNLQWTVVDESIEDYECSASVASQLGGYYIVINDDIPIYGFENTYDINMGVEGVMETLWARLQMDVVDDFGNSGTDKSDGYFILGSPEGELSAEQIGEDIIILDWGWQVGHLIAIHEDAVSFLNQNDQIEIIDYNGILNESCESEYGEIVLASLTYTGDQGHLALKGLAGSDLCEEGGTRYPGYVEGNDIFIRYLDASEDQVFTLVPDIELITGSLTFDNGITVILGFEEFEGRNVAERSKHKTRQSRFDNRISGFEGNMSISVDDRDYDSYNVYRTTQQANLRDCEDTAGCNMDNGQCVCLIANNVSQNYYFDNYAATTDQWCYDVWLLDNQDDQNELLKTIDSCMGTEIDLLFGDANEDGVINIVDVVLIVAHIMGTIPPLDDQGLIQADFNEDGVINVIDVVALVSYILTS